MTTALVPLNLKANPFEDFELLEEALDKETIERHKVLFKDRTEILQKLVLGITTSTSYKVVIHGEPGVGKSSLLNRVLHDIREARYFTVKYKVSRPSAENAQMFERELLRAFGEEITREALRSKGFLSSLEAIIKAGTKRDLKQLSILAMLYSSGQITVREGRIETDALSTSIGIPILKAEIAGEEQRHIEVTRVETLSHMVFERLVRDGVSLLKAWGYKSVVIAIDEIDKLEEKLESTILTLVKDTFYPTALCHLLLVMRTRDGRKMIHPDIFFYETVVPLAKRYVFEFLEELYKSQAIDPNKDLTSLVQKSLLDEIYEKSMGRIRSILKDLSACVISAAMQGESRIDKPLYDRTRISDAVHGYLKALQPSEDEYKIISYVLRNKEAYSRDQKLSKHVGLGRSALNLKLRNLQTRGILISRKVGKKTAFSIDPSVKSVVESIL